MYIRPPSSRLHLLRTRVHPAISHIMRDIRVEEGRVLRHHSNRLSNAVECYGRDVRVVYEHLTRGRWEKPEKKAEGGGLAAP